jgi:23S rRNA (adenine2503-C2)-methyltransferase
MFNEHGKKSGQARATRSAKAATREKIFVELAALTNRESRMMVKKSIKEFSLGELKMELERLGESGYRAVQVFQWVYQKGVSDFARFSNLSKDLREKLRENFSVSSLDLFGHLRAQDGTEKFLFKLKDGNFIETVLIPSGPRETLCLSSQVGCKFACVFCASGLKGFKRNLGVEEILDQILYAKFTLGRELTNFVFMGMGEPLDNFENVAGSIRIMNTPEGLGIAARRITVSTSGFIPGLERFKELGLQVHLSLSLHAANDGLRSRLMPISRKYPLEKVLRACEDYIQATGRKMTIEYVLIAGVNDSVQDADGLTAIAKGLKAKVNLIPYSPCPGLDYKTPADGILASFQRKLGAGGVNVTLRRSKGQDILAACGQLAGR